MWNAAIKAGASGFARQLIWREFAWHRFFHFPEMSTRNVRAKFDNFDWASRPDTEHLGQLAQWQAGRTGVPLVDADDALNAFNWQWVAGSGDDAAPYFRVFNPLTQAAKFDPQGEYVRRWVPEVNTALAPYDDIKNL